MKVLRCKLPSRTNSALASPGISAKHAALLGIGHLGLKADEIIERPFAILLAQLHHRVGPLAGARIDQADSAHWTEGQRFLAAVGHLFDGHAAFEGHETLETMGRHPLRRQPARR